MLWTHLPSIKTILVNLVSSSAVPAGFSQYLLSCVLQQHLLYTESSQSIKKISLLKGISQEKDPISQASEIQWTTGKTVIKKWKNYGTTLTLPRTGCPSKSDEKTRQKLLREAAKRPTAAPKELQSELSDWLCSIWQQIWQTSLFSICLDYRSRKWLNTTKTSIKPHKGPVGKSVLVW